MAKRKKTSDIYRMVRITGERIGTLTVESQRQSRILARRGIRMTTEALSTAQRKAQKASRETIPQLIREFNKGLKKGMKKRR